MSILILISIIDWLGFIFILLAAFTISSKYVINPKVRIFAFSCYMVACFFLIMWGLLTTGWTMFIAQQIVLTGINIRGLYTARRELKNARKNRS